MPKVTISRNSCHYANLRGLKIIVDGQHIASVQRDESVTLDVPSHEFEMYGQLDWAKTNVLSVRRAEKGDHFQFNAWVTLNPLRNLGFPTLPIRLEKVEPEARVFS